MVLPMLARASLRTINTKLLFQKSDTVLLAPQGLDQEYILHKQPAAQVLMKHGAPLTWHINSTFLRRLLQKHDVYYNMNRVFYFVVTIPTHFVMGIEIISTTKRILD